MTREQEYSYIVVLVLCAVVGAAVEPAITRWREALTSLQAAALYWGGVVGVLVVFTTVVWRWGIRG